MDEVCAIIDEISKLTFEVNNLTDELGSKLNGRLLDEDSIISEDDIELDDVLASRRKELFTKRKINSKLLNKAVLLAGELSYEERADLMEHCISQNILLKERALFTLKVYESTVQEVKRGGLTREQVQAFGKSIDVYRAAYQRLDSESSTYMAMANYLKGLTSAKKK